MIIKYLLCILLLYNLALAQTAVEGNWQGILKQPKGDSIENYAYWIKIAASKDSIKGFARTELANTPYYAIIEFRGMIIGNSVNIIQTKIVRHNRPNGTWCLIRANLSYDGINGSLKGNWTSMTPLCGNGSLLLFRSLKEINMGSTIKNKYASLSELKSGLDSNRNVEGIKIILQSVYFDSNKFIVRDKSKTELEEVVKFLRKYPRVKINIQGHTDNVGDDDLNMKLSYDRAKEIYNYLLRNYIEKSRMTYEGYGKSRPLNSNSTESNKAQNRRVEIEITKQ